MLINAAEVKYKGRGGELISVGKGVNLGWDGGKEGRKEVRAKERGKWKDGKGIGEEGKQVT